MSEILTQENFNSFIDSAQLPVLVDFYNDGCIPCKRLLPLLDRAQQDYEGKVIFATVNAAENLDLAIELNIVSVPTLIMFVDGEEADRSVGFLQEDALSELIENNL